MAYIISGIGQADGFYDKPAPPNSPSASSPAKPASAPTEPTQKQQPTPVAAPAKLTVMEKVEEFPIWKYAVGAILIAALLAWVKVKLSRKGIELAEVLSE